MLEGILIAGPLLAAGLAVIAPTAGIDVLVLSMLLAAALLPRGTSPPREASVSRASLLRHRQIVPWLLASAGTGVLYGGLRVGALGIAHRLHGGSGTAALILTVISGCSALGGIAYTALGHRLRRDPLHLTSLLLIVPGCAMIAVAITHSWLATGPVLAGLGLCTAPLITTQSLGAKLAFPAGQHAEGFTLMATAGSAGYALGSLVVALLPLPPPNSSAPSLLTTAPRLEPPRRDAARPSELVLVFAGRREAGRRPDDAGELACSSAQASASLWSISST